MHESLTTTECCRATNTLFPPCSFCRDLSLDSSISAIIQSRLVVTSTDAGIRGLMSGSACSRRAIGSNPSRTQAANQAGATLVYKHTAKTTSANKLNGVKDTGGLVFAAQQSGDLQMMSRLGDTACRKSVRPLKGMPFRKTVRHSCPLCRYDRHATRSRRYGSFYTLQWVAIPIEFSGM